MRQARGLSLAQLAALVDVTHPAVQAWETGRARPTRKHVLRLADIYGVDPEHIERLLDKASKRKC